MLVANRSYRVSMSLIALSLLLVSSPAHADSELPTARKLATVAKVCERAWPKQDEPNRELTELCAHYWLFAYNYSLREARESGVESALSLDPQVTGVEVTRFSRAQFTAMAKHARKLPRRTRDGDNWVAIRAVEYFEGAAAARTSLTALNACSGTIDCLLRQVFAGQSLREFALAGLDASHLRILRHAVYARHGRRFKDRDLRKLFYSDTARKQSGGLLPRSEKRGFRDDMLSAGDRANLTLIQRLEKRTRTAFEQSKPIFLREARR
jgi:hypothetical protein